MPYRRLADWSSAVRFVRAPSAAAMQAQRKLGTEIFSESHTAHMRGTLEKWLSTAR
jgi:hypothetical protein